MSLLIDTAAKALYGIVRSVRGLVNATLNHPARLAVILLSGQVLSALFNPFGWEALKDRNFNASTNALTGSLYGTASPKGRERLAQQHTVVVLINEATMEYFDSPMWPLPYSEQAEIVSRVASYEPAAIFLDLMYLSPHRARAEATDCKCDDTHSEPSDPSTTDRQARWFTSRILGETKQSELVKNFALELEKATADNHAGLTRRAVPTFIGPVGPDSRLSPLWELTTKAQANIRQTGLDVRESTNLIYPQTDTTGRRQAAFTIFQFLCESQRNEDVLLLPAGLLEEQCDDFPIYGQPDFDLVVRWGDRPANRMGTRTSRNSALYRQQCSSFDPAEVNSATSATTSDANTKVPKGASDEVERPWARWLFKDVIDAILGRRAELADASDCVYHDFIGAQQLFSGIPEDQLTEFIRGRTVMIGVDLDYLRDRFESPIHGDVPGVMVHAMALDNLLEYGTQASRQPEKLFGHRSHADRADLLIFVLNLFLALLILTIYRNGAGPDELTKARQFGRAFLLGLATFVSGSLASSWLFSWPLGYSVQILFSSGVLVGLVSLSASRQTSLHKSAIHRSTWE